MGHLEVKYKSKKKIFFFEKNHLDLTIYLYDEDLVKGKNYFPKKIAISSPF